MNVISTLSEPSLLPAPPSPAILDFITRWEASGAGERANYQLFLSELCDLLGVPRPEPSCPDDRDNAYVFERSLEVSSGQFIW